MYGLSGNNEERLAEEASRPLYLPQLDIVYGSHWVCPYVQELGGLPVWGKVHTKGDLLQSCLTAEATGAQAEQKLIQIEEQYAEGWRPSEVFGNRIHLQGSVHLSQLWPVSAKYFAKVKQAGFNHFRLRGQDWYQEVLEEAEEYLMLRPTLDRTQGTTALTDDSNVQMRVVDEDE